MGILLHSEIKIRHVEKVSLLLFIFVSFKIFIGKWLEKKGKYSEIGFLIDRASGRQALMYMG